MTPDDRSTLEVEAALRRHFAGTDPGPASLALHAAVDRIPTAVDRHRPTSLLNRLTPALGLAAAAAVLALLLRLVPSAGLGFGPGAGAVPTPIAFDPTLAGPGIGPAFDIGTPWLLVVLVVAILAVVVMGLDRRGRVLVGIPMVGLLGYALYGTFVPIDVQVTGYGPGLNVVSADMPYGASEPLYYEIAPPRQPFSFALLLIGGMVQPVRIESLVDDSAGAETPGLLWRALWIDGEPHGGLTGPARPFQPFTMTGNAQGIWLVGRASPCALGRVPVAGTGTGIGSTIESVRLNVTLYGWPRVIDVEVPHILEEKGVCPPSNATPAP
jgi:hypothetical protein